MEDGTSVGMIYGAISMLLTLNKNYYPSSFVLCWDGGSQKRKAVFPEYKAQRKTKHNGFYQQFLILRTILGDMGMQQCMVDGEEADDVIASLALEYSKQEEIIIVSSDHDFLQIVSNNIKVLRGGADDKLYNDTKVMEEYGVSPEKVLDISSLMGDDADNIPGIDGIGIKKASSLIKEYGSINILMEKSQTEDKLSHIKENIVLLKRNVSLMTLNTQLEKIEVVKTPKNLELVRLLFKDYFKFESLLKRWHEIESLANGGGETRVRQKSLSFF
jgi:DNA polymerase-1